MDVSDITQAQKQFKQILGYNILQVIDESIIVTNLKGHIIFWNKGAEKIFGYNESEVLGSELDFLFSEEDGGLLFKEDLENILKGKEYKKEWSGKKKDGSTVWVKIQTTVLRNNKGKIVGFIRILQDIAKREKLYRYKTELANIIEYSEDGIESMDLEGNILSWNKGAEKIYGYTAEEIIGKNAYILYSEKSKDELKENLKIIESGNSIRSFETKRKNKKGETIYVSISFSPIKNEIGKVYGVSVITRDLTEHKQTIKELIESEIKYQTIFENSGEGFLLLSDKFIECNKRLCEMWGYSKKEILGKKPGDFSPKFQPDGTLSKEKAEDYLKKAIQVGYVDFYWQHLRKDGQTLETRVTLSRIRVAGKYQIIAVVQDLSELFKYQNKLKAKSRELQDHIEEMMTLNDELNEANARLKIINKQIEANERKFRVAFMTSPDAVNINRMSDGLYIDINNGFTELTGYTEDDVRGKTSLELNIWVDPRDRKELAWQLTKNDHVSNLEAEFRRKDGTIATALMSASIIDINGEKHILSITRDISERKKQERLLRDAMQKAEESDMLKSSFLANMSHEIRTPLNAILGFSQLLKEKKVGFDKQDKYLDIIMTRSQNLLQIINDIIDISKIEANQLHIEVQDFSLNKLLYELFSQYEAELFTQNKTTIKLDFKADLNKSVNHIKSDELRLKQVLINLISNAIKFTEKGKIEFGYVVKKNKLEFFVCDTGVGIPYEAQKHIFDRFRQADDSSTRQYGGTGLGLSISQQLVKMLGGEIWVDSKPGKGSKFYFTIPFNPVNGETVEREDQKAKPIDLRGKTILIVEDDSISMAYLEELLESTQVNIEKAFDGLHALEVFNSKKIDLVLMDIHLPRMSGNEATKKIKEINKSVPVVAQSAFGMPADKKESFRHGCDEYITKPIDNRILLSTIKKYLV